MRICHEIMLQRCVKNRAFSRELARLLCGGLVVFVLAGSAFAQGSGRAKVLEGNALFAEGKFDEANNAYRDAQLDQPTSPLIDYNIANTLHEKKSYEEAIKLYDKITKNSDDPLLQAKAFYNLGNTLFRLDKWPESILAYKEALKIDPNDEDAKYNLEYVRTKLKQNADKEQQGQDKQQDQQQQKIEPSDYARRLKAQAEALVARREYQRAHDLMQRGLQEDETVAAFQDFIDRIGDIVNIEGQ